jgi:hypothetical protein
MFFCCVVINAFLLHALVVCQFFIIVHFCCSFVPSCYALLMFINVSLLCCMFLLLNVSLCVLSAHQCLLVVLHVIIVCWHLLVVCSCCSLTIPCYAFLMFIGASLLCFAFLLFVSIFLLHFVGVHRHFVVSTLVACWHLIVMCCFCPLAPPCCALLVLVGNSLLHAFLFINTSNLSTFLTPSALYCLLVVHSQCSSMPSYCDVLMLLVNTSFLSFVCVHWHLLVMRFCYSSTPCCYVFLLFVNASLLCVFVVC